MKNTFILISLFSSLVFAQTYSGQGSWQNSGGMGGLYETHATVSESDYRSAYFDQYGKHERVIEVSGEQESLVLKVNSLHSGKGYCTSDSCVFDWSEGEDQMHETWTFSDKSVTRSGSRLSPQAQSVLWRDELVRQ